MAKKIECDRCGKQEGFTVANTELPTGWERVCGAHKRMSFDTGLRIGLTAFARKTDKEYEVANAIDVPSASDTSQTETTNPKI